MSSSLSLAGTVAAKVLALYALRDSCLSRLSVATGGTYQGLAQAAREAKRQRRITPAMATRLKAIDHAYNLMRHIDEGRCATSLQQLDAYIIRLSPTPQARASLNSTLASALGSPPGLRHDVYLTPSGAEDIPEVHTTGGENPRS